MAVSASILAFSPAHASETITYGYDAFGRLVATAHAGTVNNGLASSYTFDATDNRTTVTVTGASSPPPAVGVIVVPLNGQTPIAIPAN